MPAININLSVADVAIINSQEALEDNDLRDLLKNVIMTPYLVRLGKEAEDWATEEYDEGNGVALSALPNPLDKPGMRTGYMNNPNYQSAPDKANNP